MKRLLSLFERIGQEANIVQKIIFTFYIIFLALEINALNELSSYESSDPVIWTFLIGSIFFLILYKIWSKKQQKF